MLGEIFNFVINKLERGNLVLKNSMQAISPMWVILKVMESLMVHSVTIGAVLITHMFMMVCIWWIQ